MSKSNKESIFIKNRFLNKYLVCVSPWTKIQRRIKLFLLKPEGGKTLSERLQWFRKGFSGSINGNVKSSPIKNPFIKNRFLNKYLVWCLLMNQDTRIEFQVSVTFNQVNKENPH
jgi:hypothetical protein